MEYDKIVRKHEVTYKGRDFELTVDKMFNDLNYDNFSDVFSSLFIEQLENQFKESTNRQGFVGDLSDIVFEYLICIRQYISEDKFNDTCDYLIKLITKIKNGEWLEDW